MPLPSQSAVLQFAPANTLAFSQEEKMARRRYQRGRVFLSGKRELVWRGRWREDVLLSTGKTKRIRKNVFLGTKREFPTRKLALRELDARLAPINSMSYRPLRSETFAEFSETWKAKVLSQHKPSTRSSIESQLRTAIVPYFGSYIVNEISWLSLQSFIQACQKSPKTCRNFVGTMKMMWKSARAGGWVTHDPFEGLVFPKPTQRKEMLFSPEDAARLIAAAAEPYKTLYWIAAETGMRAGELCGIRVIDVDLLNCTIKIERSVWDGTIQTPKTANAVRKMAISPQLAQHLRGYIAVLKPNEHGLLFMSQQGKLMRPSVILAKPLRKLCNQLGIPAMGLKAFRHCSATMMDQAGIPTKVRQERLGHAPGSKVTMVHYTHAMAADDRLAAASMGNRLSAVNQ